MNRTIKRGEGTVDVEIGSAWKIFDNNRTEKSISIYNGPIFRKKERVFWIETDEGGFVVDPNEDLTCWSNKTGIHLLDLKNMLQDPKNKYQIGKGFIT